MNCLNALVGDRFRVLAFRFLESCGDRSAQTPEPIEFDRRLSLGIISSKPGRCNSVLGEHDLDSKIQEFAQKLNVVELKS